MNFLKKLIKNIKLISILALLTLLIIGYFVNKNNSQSKKNEIFNLTKMLLVKNNQLKKIQDNLLKENKNLNNFINPKTINFKKYLNNNKLQKLKQFTLTKYTTDEILFTANFRGLASAYIDLINQNEIILASYDGIFAIAKLNNIKKFRKIESNISEIIKYKNFYTHTHYGIKDILVINKFIYVSYIGEEKKNCHDLRIIKAEINYDNLDFKLIYKTPGCVKQKNNYGEFLAQQGAGGRMFIGRNDTIFFTTGEFRYRTLAQNQNSFYGKIIEINLKNYDSKIISLGHRNPQGLYYSKTNNFIISTEHGPKGGDEINLIKEPGKKILNFGWPISSYGDHYYKNYSKEKLKKAPLKKNHSKYGFVEPLIFFNPSIGISEIIPINKEETEFFFGAMGSEISEKDLSLHYIKLNKSRTKVINHKYEILNERVRDIIVSKDFKTIYLFLETTSSIGILKRSN